MIETYEGLGCWLENNGFHGSEGYKNYEGYSFNRKGRYRVEKSANAGKACVYSIDTVEILTYERAKQY